MKTVWHWKEIGKLTGCTLGVGTVWGIFCALTGIPPEAGGPIGTLIGMGTFFYCAARWDFYTFV